MRRPAIVNVVETFLDRETVRAGTLMVALSGGPDSMALLWALRSLAPKFNLAIVAGHLNHQLRGEESDADQAFVEDFCRRNQIELRVARHDVGKAAVELGDNLESAARRLRYDWLIEVATECGAAWIATGHTTDDQAETVLHNLLRGTGLRGLRGIAPRRPLATGIEVIRPLLKARRHEVEVYLHAEGISARQDSSNLDLRFTRNRIRHELLPLLRQQFNPEISTLLAQLAEQAGELYQAQEEQARTILSEAERPRAGPVIVLDAERLAREKRHLIREVFHLIWEREEWPLGGTGFVEWDRLADLVFGMETARDFPGGVHARRKGKALQLRVASKRANGGV